MGYLQVPPNGGGAPGAVTSVQGLTGDVVLTTDDIPQTLTHMYVSAATVRPLLSATAPIDYDNSTGVFSMHVADASHNGYLSSSDWTTFNSKVGGFPILATTNIVAYSFAGGDTDTGLGSPSDGITRMFNNGVTTMEWQPGQITSYVNLYVTDVIYPNKNPNLFLAGPVSGGPAAPTFRVIAQGDVPASAITFPMNAPLGTNNAPSFNFDPDTGMYSEGDGNVSWSANTVKVMEIDPSQLHVIQDLNVDGNITAANYPPTSSNNSFAGFGNTGALESIPGWTFSNTTKGLSVSQTYAPSAPTGFNYNSFFTSIQQTADIDTSYMAQMYLQVSMDPADSGFKSGGVDGLVIAIDHKSTSAANNVSGIRCNTTLGDGALSGGSADRSDGAIFELGAIGGYTIGAAVGITLAGAYGPTSTITNYIGILQNTQVSGDNSFYTSYQASPVIDSPAITNWKGILLSPAFGTNSSTAIDSHISFNSSTSLGGDGSINSAICFDDAFSTNTSSRPIANYTSFNARPLVNSSGTSSWSAFVDGGNFGQNFATDISQYRTFQAYTAFKSNATIANYTGIILSPTFQSGSALTGDFTGFILQPQLDSGVCSNYRGWSNFPNLGSGAAFSTSNYYGIQENPTLASGSTITNYNGLTLNSNFQAGSTVGVFNGLTISTANPGTTLSSQCNGITVQLDNFVLVDGIKNGINIGDGSLQSGYNLKTSNFPGGISGFFQVNALGVTFEVSSGFPLTGGQMGFANNIGSQFLFLDDMNAGAIPPIGVSSNGFVGQIGVALGKTADTVNYMFAGAQVAPFGGDGGTVTNLAFYTAYGLIDGGGNMSVTNMYGFRVIDQLTSFSPTNAWGFHCDDPNADNYFKKSVVVGGTTGLPDASACLDITSTTHGVKFPSMTTVQRDAIAAPADGLVIFNSTTSKLQCFASATWNDMF